ncbi:MAG: TIGR04255 family protein [Kineosporiaceae bacterium]|nr:TIGR04255 family protein [Kineosporiaceae bacterium]MBK7622557.1 TIGR04255 family protein [Kineosporiaceae bacterium]
MPKVDESIRRRRYAEPPVVEAIARLEWARDGKWSVATPGVLLGKLRSDYPAEPQLQAGIQVGMAPGVNEGGAQLSMSAGVHNLIYASEDGSRLLSASPKSLGVHGLVPYEGWEALDHRLVKGVKAVSPTLFNGPPMVAAVGLRYVNRIVLPSVEVNFHDYFTITFAFPDEFPPTIGAFLDRAEFGYPGEPITLAFTWASTEAPPDRSAFIVDLDYQWRPPRPVTVPKARRMLADLKRRETLAFESLLTDRLRGLFREVS